MKSRLVCMGTLFLALATGCSQPQIGERGARTALDASAKAMGGWKALQDVRTQRVVSQGSDWDPIQAMRPGETRQVNSFSSALAADFEQKSLRLEFRAQLVYPREGPEQFTEVISGDFGMLQQADSKGQMKTAPLHESRYATRLRDLKRMPVRVLLTARQAEGLHRLPDQTSDRASYQILEYKDATQKVELRTDSSTHLPARITYLEDDPVFGDTRNEFIWSDWKDVGGVRLPYYQEQRLNGLTIRKEKIREIQNNPSLPPNAFTIPEEIRQSPKVGERIVSQWVLRRVSMGVTYLDFGQPQKVTLEKIAPGIVVAGGTSHQTLIIEMKDHLMIVEAPLYEERSVAVIRAIKETFPTKPIRYVVVTHFHSDHSGGLRAYAAEGATFIGQSSILPFLQSVLTSPKTVKPDTLALLEAKTGKPHLKLEGIETMREFTDGTRVARIYAIPNPHVNAMLGAYLPKERITFTADLVSSADSKGLFTVEPRSRAYYDFVRRQGLKVDRIARVHGPVISFRQFAAGMENRSDQQNLPR